MAPAAPHAWVYLHLRPPHYGRVQGARCDTTAWRDTEPRKCPLWVSREAPWPDLPERVALQTYAKDVWWPSLHVELTTKAACRSNLETHFLPFFGDMRMANILPSHVQAWVNQSVEGHLTSRSVVKYHLVLHSILRQAVRDRIIPFNPAAETKLPKVVRRQRRILTPRSWKPCSARSPNAGYRSY